MAGSFIDFGDCKVDFDGMFRRRTRTTLRDRLKEMFPEMVGDTDLALDIPASKPLRYGYHPADCPKCGKRNYTGGNSLCGGAALIVLGGHLMGMFAAPVAVTTTCT